MFLDYKKVRYLIAEPPINQNISLTLSSNVTHRLLVISLKKDKEKKNKKKKKHKWNTCPSCVKSDTMIWV